VAGDPAELSDESRADVERTERVLRAVGLLGGSTDLGSAVTKAQRSGTLALYSFDRKEVLVRGTTLDTARRVTIAHELTHALQDQHFDLGNIVRRSIASQSGDAASMRGQRVTSLATPGSLRRAPSRRSPTSRRS
jgi:hypothetical protein